MRLIRAELLKIRRRQATWVLLGVAAAITAIIYMLLGRSLGGFACQFQFQDFGAGECVVEFPAAYALMDQFAFATLGGVLAIVFAAALVGSDWSWGVLRSIIARGESRSTYLLAKAAGIAIALAVGVLIIFALAFVMTYISAFLSGIPVASPLRGRGLEDLAANLLLGYPVVLERAALGFAVAAVLRSQLAGAVVGIVLYLGEGIVTTFLTIAGVAHNIGGVFSGGLRVVGPEWFQYLPMTVGNQVLSAAPGVASSPGTGGVEGLFLRPVPLEQALPVLLFYLVVAMVAAIVALNRQEIA